ncbi:hypothetical protein Q4561_00670 [Alteromonas sp. 1_MG-2023]|uniref:hypothetical protein n=1 Tax=Alteromonas sp. 1_MG-2023 TaxID=3062669 RepID=UPI0026E35713|nr:hypothetical protein [Alteromonas sp. 1_MG-2023]MDO6565558.1 hypothetical protein [Alteromonas sp. 1_MG-2023]
MRDTTSSLIKNCLAFLKAPQFKLEAAKSIISVTSLLVISVGFTASSYAGSREQAMRMHERLAGVPASESTLDAMQSLIEAGDTNSAAYMAMEHPAFYNVTLKTWVAPWTNEAFDKFEPLNDYIATVVGMVRDDIDFREVLSGDILYVGDNALSLPAYSNTSNEHYLAMEDEVTDLKAHLVQTTQSAVTGLPSEATAGVMTTRAAAKAFFKDGTNRAMFRFTLINHMCTDLEGVADITRAPDRIRQDVSRSPGGDSRVFHNNCVSCHSGMDPLAQAFAYYNYRYDAASDPDGDQGTIEYNSNGETDPVSGTRVQEKYLINGNNFVHGFVTDDDSWDNYWREGVNYNLGWSQSLTGSGQGAKSMGEELANSQQFAECQVTKVFEEVCLRSPQDSDDRDQITALQTQFATSGYQMKSVFAEAANYCKGD